MRDGKQNNYFWLIALIIISITLGVFFLLNKYISVYHIFGLFFIIAAEIIFIMGVCKTIAIKKINRPPGEIYGIFAINNLIMIFVSIIFIIEEGESLLMFIIIELILLSIGLILLNSMVAEKDNNINK
ncbi:hypothetical protein ACPWSR_02700 [Alloiococcus sp. CFN-8]|uniref:hypothetical protein n=1 Tax=Alloiococcus sp. CFN-8 TaxID=3416081 RepID=UPI003CF05218